MFGIQLLELERNEFIRPCGFWLRNVPVELQKEIAGEVLATFDQYKYSRADSEGFVTVHRGFFGGLLDQGKVIRVPIGEASTYECAGPFVHNDIDLAFKLWLDKFKPFEDLLDRHGWLAVFALIGIWSHKDADPRSLIRLNGMLTEQLAGFALVANRLFVEESSRNAKARWDAAQARKLGVESNKQRGIQAKRDMRLMADEYRRAHPSAKVPEICEHIRENCPHANGKQYSIHTIRQGIAGTSPRRRRNPLSARK